MNTKEWKQNELNRLLMEKFNLKEKEEEKEEELDEAHLHPGQSCDEAHEGMEHEDYANSIAIRLET